MSEIASKANNRPSASLAQTLVKKGGDTTHEILFAALFGGFVAVETNTDPMTCDLAPVNADADTDANPDGNSDILVAMQVVAAMMSGQRDMGRSGGSDANAASPGDAVSVDEDDLAGLDGEPNENRISVNSMMIGPMPLQHQTGTSLPVAETSGGMAQMALEDEAVMPHQRNDRAVLNTATSHPSGAQLQKAALSSSYSLQTLKFAEKSQSLIGPNDDMPSGELDIEASQFRPDGRTVIRPVTYQQNKGQAGLTNNKSANRPDQALIDVDGDMQFDSPDDVMRAAAGKTERSVGGVSGQSLSGESLSANAVRQMQSGGLSFGGQMSHQNSGQSGGQTGGQSGGLASANAGMTNGSMMGMLDMAQDNWTEMLLQRVERGLAGGKDKIDFHLNPRNLGKMRISLVVQNERTHVHIQTETSAAAQLLSDSEARLAQMMDVSGLRFGNLTFQHNQNFGGNFAGQNSGQGREGGSAHAVTSSTTDEKDETNAEISVEQSENLINLQA